MQYVFHEPKDYAFRDRNGHDGKVFNTTSPLTQHLIVECHDKLTVAFTQREAEFNYYVLEGQGFFVINDDRQTVSHGDLVVIPPGTRFTYGGQLKMLPINTPHWSQDHEKVDQL